MTTPFRILVVFMVFSMLGLIAFQWYWIENAIAVKNQQFDRNVMDALNETVRKVEKQEIIYVTQQKLKESERNRLVTIAQNKNPLRKKKTEVIRQVIKREDDIAKEAQISNENTLTESAFKVVMIPDGRPSPMLIPEQNLEHIREIVHQQDRIWEQLTQPNNDFSVREQRVEEMFDAINAQVWAYQNSQMSYVFVEPPFEQALPDAHNATEKPTFLPPKKIRKPQLSEVDFQKTKNKANLLKDVFSDFIRGQRSIYERVNQKMLDTLLKEELKARNITLNFEYGVKNNGNMLFTSFGNTHENELLKSEYSVHLFPNDVQPQSQLLYVFFPQKKNFILTNMWSVFGSSLLIVLMIGGIFYSSMNTIMRQKKISNIKNDFINNMTHEFKTPISTISLAVQVLKDKNVEKDEEKNRRYLTIIQDENQRLGSQVEKVLQMALLDKGDMNLMFEAVNIHEIIEQVLTNISVQIEQKEGIVNLELDADFPEIMADDVHITNIVYNLIDNANKYSPKKPNITIKTENIGKELKISISDEGIGMTKEQISKIFDKFYRVHTGNLHDVKGFGLGLSYVKKMVESHNGRIQVESKQQKGTTFHIFMPTN